MTKIYCIIFGSNSDNSGDIYCAATSHELAEHIINKDKKDLPDLENAFIVSVNLWNN